MGKMCPREFSDVPVSLEESYLLAWGPGSEGVDWRESWLRAAL